MGNKKDNCTRRVSVIMLRGSAGSDINTRYNCLKTEESLFQTPVRELKITVVVQESNQYKRVYTGESEKKVVLISLVRIRRSMVICI
jgi:hypothetical protein